jgi:hypothetical protein
VLLGFVPALSLAQQSPGRPADFGHSSQASVLYVVGAGKKPGGYSLRQGETVTVWQAIALVGGLSETAKASGAKVIRRHGDGSTFAEVPVDLRKILRAGGDDIELGATDILYVPDSRPPRTLQRRAPMGDPILYNYQLSGGALCPLGANS